VSLPQDLKNLEPRKLAEIEHSRKRRSILQSDERKSDAPASERPRDLDGLIRDKSEFEVHFSNQKFYAITGASEQYQQSWLRERCRPGVRVLDFACGNGENGIFAAQCGAESVGIDISPEGIANANANTLRAGVHDRCRFEVMDGENLKFPDNSFDVGVEYGALHHVDLERALSELARVIRPGGQMICTEALRHNPLIHAYRRRTPHLRTEWEFEHILGVESLDVARRHFREVNVRFFHLAALAAVPFRRAPFFRPLRKVLDAVDGLLLGNQLIGKYAWIMIFTMGDPRKAS
jgi:SAM-dependent methyltransferase